MTEEVAALVLRNNYLQTLSISLTRARGSEENGYAMALMHDLEERGLLDRKLEALPSDAEIVTRDGRGETLTRPEHSVLLAYSKIALYDDLLKSTVPDDPFLSSVLQGYFPQRMHARYGKEIDGHRLTARNHRDGRRQRADQPRRPGVRVTPAGRNRRFAG